MMQGVIQAIRGTHQIYVDDAILIAGKTKFSPKCNNGENNSERPVDALAENGK